MRRRAVLILLLYLALASCRLPEEFAPTLVVTPAVSDEGPTGEFAGTPMTVPTQLAGVIVQQTAAAYASQGDAVSSPLASQTAAPGPVSLPALTETALAGQDAPIIPSSLLMDCSPGIARFNALHIRNRIILDGNVDAWYASFHEASNVVSGMEQWAGDWDLSTVFQTGWTEQAFYVVVRVTDERYVQGVKEPDEVQKGDSIDLLLDVDLCGDLDSSTMNGDDFHLRISPGYMSTEGDRTAFRMQPSPADAVSQIMIASSRIGSVTNYEIEIPWNALGISDPAAGQMIRFALLVNDNDDPQENLQESVLATTLKPLEDSLDPRDWALLELRE